jgi:hypothetical protein
VTRDAADCTAEGTEIPRPAVALGVLHDRLPSVTVVFALCELLAAPLFVVHA